MRDEIGRLRHAASPGSGVRPVRCVTAPHESVSASPILQANARRCLLRAIDVVVAVMAADEVANARYVTRDAGIIVRVPTVSN